MRTCTTCGQEWPDDVRFCPNDGSIVRPDDPSEGLMGTVLADRYLVLEPLGQGGMGMVYLAQHVKMDIKVAVKVMSPELAANRDAIARFHREAKNAARIRHQNVCVIHDFGETPEGLVYLAMEYIDGESLTNLLRREGALAPDRAADILVQCCDALRAAHDLGIVHRDLKPDNIMITAGRDGADLVKVVDFGIAKATAAESGQTVTKSGFLVGTPEYMSPEQIAGGELDTRSDTYSLGLVLFKMLTGSLPFKADTPEETFAARLTEEPRKLHEAVSDAEFPEELQAVLDRALARSRQERFGNTMEFGLAVRDAVAGMEGSKPAVDVNAATSLIDSAATPGPSPRPQPAAPDAPTPETPQPIPVPGPGTRTRRPVTAYVLGAVLLFALGGATVAIVMRKQSSPEPEGEAPIGAVPAVPGVAAVPTPDTTTETDVPETDRTPRETSTPPTPSRWADELPAIEAMIGRGAYNTALERLDFMRQQDIFDRDVNALIVRAVRSEVQELASATDYDGAIERLSSYLDARPYLESLGADLENLYLDRIRYRIEHPDPREIDPGWTAYRQLVEAFEFDAELRYQAVLLLLEAGDVPAASVIAILAIDSTMRHRDPLLAYARSALDREEWWNNRAAQELIGTYYLDELEADVIAGLDSPDANRRLNAYEVLREYAPARLSALDLYPYHRRNVTGIRDLLELGNPQAPLRRTWAYLYRLDDENRIAEITADLRAIPPADLRYAFAREEVAEVVDRLTRSVYPVYVREAEDSLSVVAARYRLEFRYTDHEALRSEAEAFAGQARITFMIDRQRVADQSRIEPVSENPAPRLTCRTSEGERPCSFETTWRYEHPALGPGDHPWSFQLVDGQTLIERVGVVRVSAVR